jgi:hypothetical protein
VSDPNPIGDYCDYLDKEMTIMGLLTAFCVAVPALVLDRIATAKESEQKVLYIMWQSEQTMLVAGSLFFFLAAFGFYLQRSRLALYYGQLRFSRTEACYEGVTSKAILERADSWAAWIPYNNGFVLLVLGFAVYGAALFAPQSGASHAIPIVGCLSLPALLCIAVNWRVKSKYRYEDHPWATFFRNRRPPQING